MRVSVQLLKESLSADQLTTMSEVTEKKMMFEYYSTLLGTQNSSSDNLDGFLPDGLEDIKLELVTKNGLSPLNGDTSTLSECSLSDEGSLSENLSCGGGKMKSKLSTKPGKDDKICAVCGDKALGCNFDAISCESCKAFFRRNAMKEAQMKCLFDGQCKIDVNTRRFCPYCRLKRCLNVGMKKHLILDIEEKKKRMEKVVKNREKRQGKPTDSIASSAPPSIGCVSPPLTPGPLSSCQSFSPPHHLTLQPEMTNLLTLSRLISSSESSVSMMPTASVDSLLLRRLTAEETHMLHELNQVYDLSFTVDLEPLIHIKQLNPSLNQLVNQSSITVLRLIKFAKRLEEFVRLSQECQISILKGCWMHMLLLRSVSLYDCERDVWVTPRGDIPTEILKNATGYVQLHDDHIQYCKSIKSIIGNDLTIVVILLVLVLFAPEGAHVVMRDLVSNIQDRYLVLLKHYLEAKYTYLRTAEMFPQLLNKIRELNTLAEVHGKILLEINPEEIEPIMLEILDIK